MRKFLKSAAVIALAVATVGKANAAQYLASYGGTGRLIDTGNYFGMGNGVFAVQYSASALLETSAPYGSDFTNPANTVREVKGGRTPGGALPVLDYTLTINGQTFSSSAVLPTTTPGITYELGVATIADGIPGGDLFDARILRAVGAIGNSFTGSYRFADSTKIMGLGLDQTISETRPVSGPGSIVFISYYTGPRYFELNTTNVTSFSLGPVALGPGGVPEPASWALMIAGFGAVGTSMRRAKVRVTYA